jgi:translation initiation factor 1
MASLQDQLSRLVYSTEKGDLCPECGEALTACVCSEQAEQIRIAAMDGVVRIRRETSGRKGKAVTTISGVPRVEAELKVLLKKLKQGCGSGGAVKEGVIEIQGDHREKLKTLLEKEGFTVKLAGG